MQASEAFVQHGFCVRRGDVQTWSFVLLFKCSAVRQFSAPKPARTQSPKTLAETLWRQCNIEPDCKKRTLCKVGEALFAILRKSKREATPNKSQLKLLHICFCPNAPKPTHHPVTLDMKLIIDY
jgi:hypothetical protein